MFQAKSTLDNIAQLIGMVYRLTGVVTYANDGDKLIDKLQKSSAHRDSHENKQKLIQVLLKNKNWIKDFVNMRDLVTHFSDLIGFKSAIHTIAIGFY